MDLDFGFDVLSAFFMFYLWWDATRTRAQLTELAAKLDRLESAMLRGKAIGWSPTAPAMEREDALAT